MRATEITTARGHANVYGVDGFVDFRLSRPGNSHVLADIVHAGGGLLSINHDKPGIPWDYALPRLDCMEVWQSSWLTSNWVSLARYQQRLASGRRISAIGGSDFHQPEELLPEGPFALARPTTVLWLDELSEEAVLAAMKAGRGYVTESPSGPHLSLTAAGQPMGGSVPSGPVETVAEVRGAPGDELVWLDATGVLARQSIAADDWAGTYTGTPVKFIRAEIHARASRAPVAGRIHDGTCERRARRIDRRHGPRDPADPPGPQQPDLRRPLTAWLGSQPGSTKFAPTGSC